MIKMTSKKLPSRGQEGLRGEADYVRVLLNGLILSKYCLSTSGINGVTIIRPNYARIIALTVAEGTFDAFLHKANVYTMS